MSKGQTKTFITKPFKNDPPLDIVDFYKDQKFYPSTRMATKDEQPREENVNSLPVLEASDLSGFKNLIGLDLTGLLEFNEG